MIWLIALYMAVGPGNIQPNGFATMADCKASGANYLAQGYDHFTCFNPQSDYWWERNKTMTSIIKGPDAKLDEAQRWTYQLCRIIDPNCPYVASSMYCNYDANKKLQCRWTLPGDLP